MKKLICIVASCLMIAALSTSCSKTCTCDTYSGGKVVSSEEISLGTVANCSLMTAYNETEGEGIKCH